MSENKKNHLANETSPYLLQHVNNPVDWYPWGEEALQKAQEENKPILLSIGYSSCHWCHVMAHESFENQAVADIMNEHFVNIKLDREERPDIDNIYMDAVQMMGLRGGWPLNVFLTPDQKPFYGGTYFPPEQWKRLLISVADAYQNKYDQIYESASKFALGLQQSEAEKYGLNGIQTKITPSDLEETVNKIKSGFDQNWGGLDKAPKFPMPAIWNFLLTYSQINNDPELDEHLTFTLDKIAAGGIYDHVGGGFARYSVDGEWHVPHFEKMLYDNGQLLSLYANAFKKYQKPEYFTTIIGIAEWLEREMLTSEGGFYSALDADSEGEEGKFYVWDYEEVRSLAGKDLSIIAEYFDISPSGNWENGVNVFRKLESDQELAEELNMSIDDLNTIIDNFKQKALSYRNERIKPGLDSKILAGWNALTLSGLCKAYQATGDGIFENLAKQNAIFIKEKLINNHHLIRTYGKSTEGFLEDYSAVIQGFIVYYETFFDEDFLKEAIALTETTMNQFFDQQENLFYFNSQESHELIARKKEIFDNVIPASNSIMAENLYRIGIMTDNEEMITTAENMVAQMNKLIKTDGEFLSNWANISLKMIHPLAEIILVGSDAKNMAINLQKISIPNSIIMATKNTSDFPLFQHKSAIKNRTTIYVCFEKTCQKPVHTLQEAIKLINFN
jgi:uncharacterized protein YyaL (SSP411 family)